VRAGDEISDLYDPLIAKLVVHDVDRERARRRALRALEEFDIRGPKTLIGFHRALLSAPCFVAGETCRGVVESDELAKHAHDLDRQLSHMTTNIRTASDGFRQAAPARLLDVELDGRRHEIRVHSPEPAWAELARRHKERRKGLRGAATNGVVSPMQGTVLEVGIAEGDAVEAGALICVIEAMKMENEVAAHRDGVVAELHVRPGQQVAEGELICVIETESASG
jgi:acetyl-CoA/propionyl-CoA carboxylase, biotin carboxylase, biotin carboxyl carrier protein